jgi:hypothetical protein
MNPCVARGGCSFKGAFQYYMHDKGSNTRERIGWTQNINILTRDPDKAWRVMAYTAKSQDRLKVAAGVRSTGRKTEKPVMAYSLSWHPAQNPDKDHMLEVAMRSLKTLGLSEHEAIVISHTDTPHRHAHVIVNRIHPVSGKVASISHSFRKLSTFALEYARDHGLNYAPQREENLKKREKGERYKVIDKRIQNAWDRSIDGMSFSQELKSTGLTLARGDRRYVVIDDQGKVMNPYRHIEGIKTKDLADRLRRGPKLEISTVEGLSKGKVKINPCDSIENAVPDKGLSLQTIEKSFRDESLDFRKKHDYERFQMQVVKLEKEIERSSLIERIFGLKRLRQKKLNLVQDRLRVLDESLIQIREKWSLRRSEIENQRRSVLVSERIVRVQEISKGKTQALIQNRIQKLRTERDLEITR